ncbi:MAG TPA: type II secretion system F family protein [Candidatus Woesearchaeota archaeon]|jgi:pilus assembly protein TadC|nr:type II secretion system F family protein [Candidatus Woesearchaeota archaeon]HJO02233.1 type II secretion system F family protein [Candidatus Woesearchaeota archaeon]|tara:strand:- start:409 stop:1233 length:825 start_codon:yes stop_codon:yes gene_type:complete
MKKAITKLVQRISTFFPHLKKQIRIAHLKTTPYEFIYKNLKSSLAFSLALTILFFFVADKAGLPLILIPVAFIVFFILVFNFAFLKIKSKIIQRQRKIDQEVLFVGQYLLIMLYSGRPLLNALIDTSKSYGVASKYIKEIINDINTGSSLEDALENAMVYSPSEKFRKILFHVNNALKLGIDVTNPLRAVLEEIATEQNIEVKRYGKKLNTIVIFYMLVAIVAPSIGMTVFIVLSSFIELNINMIHFIIVIMFIAFMQVIFISVFKSIRPAVNL